MGEYESTFMKTLRWMQEQLDAGYTHFALVNIDEATATVLSVEVQLIVDYFFDKPTALDMPWCPDEWENKYRNLTTVWAFPRYESIPDMPEYVRDTVRWLDCSAI